MFQLVTSLVIAVTSYGSQATAAGSEPIGFGGGHYIGGIGHHHGFGLGLRGAGFGFGGGLGLGHRFIGGEQIDHNIYGGDKKNVNNGRFHKVLGNHGGEINHGGAGFAKGEEIATNLKGESAHFSDTHGGEKVHHDGKDYHGGQHFEKEGHGGEEKTVKKGHKKGHTIKGFKSSHHKDESGKTEEFYDEEHDEAGNYAFNGQTEAFGEKGASAFKGGHQEAKINSDETLKSGHHEHEILADKAYGTHGKFGEHKHAGRGGTTGEHKLLGVDDISGHHETSNIYKHVPIHF